MSNKNNFNLNAQKQRLFAHADPSFAIKQMKSVNHHLTDTRNLLHDSYQRIIRIKQSTNNISNNLIKTNSMYGQQYEKKIGKAGMYIKQLQKRQASNNLKIKISFIFLIFTVCYIVIRRIMFPDLYRWG